MQKIKPLPSETGTQFGPKSTRLVATRSLPGENKFQLILRKLQAGSLAHAIKMYGLENYEGNVWAKLESLAAQEVTIQRNLNKISRAFSRMLRGK